MLDKHHLRETSEESDYHVNRMVSMWIETLPDELRQRAVSMICAQMSHLIEDRVVRPASQPAT